MYITLAQLADRPGAKELAEVATPAQSPILDAALFDAILRGKASQDIDPETQQAVDAAMATIQSAVEDAAGLIDGYLELRGYVLPLDPAPRIAVFWARSIARYTLHKDRISNAATDSIVRDYEEAIGMLKLLSTGKLTLGAGDVTAPDQPQGLGPVEVACDHRHRPGPWDVEL